ncbi:MAG: ABC transporter ATP-binding protein [Thermoanaerobaculales bacterium]|nr:ABC transporter ATP-binding protein [Thermoanaerobaculales bacterium]
MKPEFSNSPPVATIEELTVRFGRLAAVRKVSFKIKKGNVYALLGRNGSGKSTTVRVLLGQLRAQEGRTQIFGLDAWTCRRKIMERVGVAPEAPDVPPEMTALQVARFVAPLYSGWKTAAFLERLERFGVPSQRRFSRLSKGQSKQVNLALALSSSPEFVILDDPTLGLDAVARKALFDELIGDLAERGTTVLITTHDLAGIEGVADQVGVMSAGSLVLDEPIEDLKSRFRRLRYPTVEGDGSLAEARPSLGESRVVGGQTEVIVSEFDEEAEKVFREKAGERLQIEGMDLEEIFLAVCGKSQGGVS